MLNRIWEMIAVFLLTVAAGVPILVILAIVWGYA